MAVGTSYRKPGALPAQASGFVGRVAELGRARELLRESRLVTVTGPGGAGKSRLALRVAADAAPGYRDGVYLAELSSVSDPELLAATVAARFAPAGGTGAEPRQGAPLDLLLDQLRGRELLLVLDTCEHLAAACAALAGAITREAPGVTILATSRQALHAAGEAVQPLDPLPVPEEGSPTAGQADAVELFALRAAAALPGFKVTGENLADVITVCRSLDGLPLAIELAAVRLRALPLHEMASRGDGRLRLLTGERRSGTPRHQSLRASIEWSHRLCTPAEQLLWARLSVFAGRFGADAAAEVCAGGALPREEVAAVLASLADKSLLTRDSAPDAAGAPRAPAFRMLGTLREFGAGQLRLAGTREVARWRGATARAASGVDGDGDDTGTGQAEAAVHGKYIAYYLELAEDFERDPVAGQLGKLRRLAWEHANLRAAFGYALALPGNDSAAILLATCLCYYWQVSGQLREAEYWLDRAEQRCPRRSAARARVLAARGYVRAHLGDPASASADASAAIAMAAPFSDAAAAARGHAALAWSKHLAEAREEAARCYAGLGDVLGLAQLDLLDALTRLQAGELEQCHASTAKGLARLPTDELWCSSSLYGLQSLVLFLHGDFPRAAATGLLALLMKQRVGDETGTAFCLSSLAFMAASQGRCERAAWLFGAAAPLWERAGHWYQGNGAFEALHRVAERIARARLGDERYWEVRAAGSAAPLGHAVERAVADADELGEPVARP